jgi:phosphoribosylamine--glycine ligase
MNIALLSPSSSYQHLAKKFIEQGHTVDLLLEQPVKFTQMPKFFMASGIPVCRSKDTHMMLNSNKIPYFFVNNQCTEFENDKFLTKKMLQSLNIPTANGVLVSREELKQNFNRYQLPFVVKINYAYQYGRQTVVVTEENKEDVYKSMFTHGLFHVKDDASIVLEDFVELDREYSYHALFNFNSWRFFGAARDYKKLEDGDVGYNSVSCGAYSTQDVDKVVHEYADKIYSYFKKIKLNYRGFIFLGIGVRKDGTPIVLEINTRSGDPELQVMVECIDNDLASLFANASCDFRIPEIKFNGKQAVTVSLLNTYYDWTIRAYDLPNLKDVPSNITYSLDYPSDYLKHGVLTAVANTRQAASKLIYTYLDTQHVGQYRYRKDIGILE